MILEQLSQSKVIIGGKDHCVLEQVSQPKVIIGNTWENPRKCNTTINKHKHVLGCILTGKYRH